MISSIIIAGANIKSADVIEQEFLGTVSIKVKDLKINKEDIVLQYFFNKDQETPKLHYNDIILGLTGIAQKAYDLGKKEINSNPGSDELLQLIKDKECELRQFIKFWTENDFPTDDSRNFRAGLDNWLIESVRLASLAVGSKSLNSDHELNRLHNTVRLLEHLAHSNSEIIAKFK